MLQNAFIKNPERIRCRHETHARKPSHQKAYKVQDDMESFVSALMAQFQNRVPVIPPAAQSARLARESAPRRWRHCSRPHTHRRTQHDPNLEALWNSLGESERFKKTPSGIPWQKPLLQVRSF